MPTDVLPRTRPRRRPPVSPTDVASRWQDDRSEAWTKVQKAFGPHSTNLFASRGNALCLRYFSRWLGGERRVREGG